MNFLEFWALQCLNMVCFENTVGVYFSVAIVRFISCNCGNVSYKVWRHYFEPLKAENVASLMPVLLHPHSRGVVSLRSSDPLEPPDIDPRYLSDPHDMKILYEGNKFMIVSYRSLNVTVLIQFRKISNSICMNNAKCYFHLI